MEYYTAVLNYNLRKIYVNDLKADYILSVGASDEKFWYVLNEDETVAGCIGRKEYLEICEKRQIVVKKDFQCIHSGKDEKQLAIAFFMANPKFRRLPVLNDEGKLLYEYIKSMEVYYDELIIRDGINLEKGRKEKIVVSLTSYGKRLDMVYLTIKSIMHQTLKADEIVLYISEEDSKKNIKRETELVKAGLVIRRNVKDLKPHKKYFYAVQEYPKSIIVTVDDDTMYDDTLLEDLYKNHLKYPEAVICRRGHRMLKKDGRVAPYNLWEGCVACTAPERSICATGVGGVLYPCGEYRKAFCDEHGIRETSLCGDDLWLKTIELIYGIDVFAIGETPTKIIEGSQEAALYIENADNKRNDKYLENLQTYFHVNLASLF